MQTVQYNSSNFSPPFSGQQFLHTGGATLTSVNNTATLNHVFSFPTDLPGTTANKFFLVGTAGLAMAPGGITPDYTVPNDFLFTGGGTLDYGPGADALTYGALPTRGILSLNRDGTIGVNSPTNFSGQTGSVVPLPASALLFVSGISALFAFAQRKRNE